MLAVYYLAIWIVILMFVAIFESLVFFVLSLVFGLKIKVKGKKITVLCLSGSAGLLFTLSIVLFFLVGLFSESTIFVYLLLLTSFTGCTLGTVAFILAMIFRFKRSRAAAVESKPIEVKVVQDEPKPSENNNYIDELKQLKELHDSGAITDEEFAKAKEKILG